MEKQYAMVFADAKPGQEALCPVCRSSDLSFSKHRGHGSTSERTKLHCESCDLVFYWPLAAGSAEWYANLFAYQTEGTRPEPPTAKLLMQIWEIQQFFALRIPPGRLLDVGCGTGKFLAVARDQGHEVFGIDFNANSIEFACSSYGLRNLFAGDLTRMEEIGFDTQFDYITMFNVLEHLENPVGVLRQYARLLRRGGSLVVHLPAHSRRPALYSPVLDYPPNHLTFWSEASVTRLFQESGLTPCTVKRKPFLSSDVLVYLTSRFPILRVSGWRGRLLWGGGRRLMSPLMETINWLSKANGFHVFGVGQRD